METVRVELELRRLRHNDGGLEERNKQRQQIEAIRTELEASNSHLVALKYELSKTLVGLSHRNVYRARSDTLIALIRL